MANRRRKRATPDGVALSEWIFFGVLVIVPIACFGVYAIVSRWCNIFLLQPGRYCSFDETIAWLWSDGGWWKLLILFTIVGVFAYRWCGDKEEESTQERSDTESENRD